MLLLLLTLAPLTGLHAQEAGARAGSACHAPEAGAPCDGSGPASQAASDGIDLGAGNPINVVTGNKYQMEVDLPALPGELGLEIVRHYNSAARHVVGQLGTGWRLSYETDLYRVGQSVQILQADGRRLTFAVDPANPNQCSGSDPSQGWIQILEAGAGSARGYIWHWTHGPQAGRQLHFDAHGKLVRIRAASGALLTLTRGARGELLQVMDPQGRILAFSHGGPPSAKRARERGAAAVFTGITSIDSPVGRFEYRHGSRAEGEATAEADPEHERAQAANLIEVRLPGQADQGIRRIYHYEDSRHRQALTGISVRGAGSDGDPMDERIASYAYDGEGRAILSVRGAPPDNEAMGAGARANTSDRAGPEQVRLQILEPARPTRAGRSLLTNSLGRQTLYTHRIIGGQYRLIEAVGAGCTQCGPVNMRWNYDEAGRLIEQIMLSPTAVKGGQPQGDPQPLQSTRHVTDAHGLRIERIVYVDGRAQSPEPIERQQYADPRWPDKPTRISRPSVVAGAEHSITLVYNEAGQPTEITERGYSPLTARGAVAATPRQAMALARSTSYSYTLINGRSLLARIDGPQANGDETSPGDGHITTLEWDDSGSFITRVTSPGERSNRLTHHPVTGLLARVENDAGFATTFAYDTRLQLTRVSSRGPGWAQPWVQTVRYNALGHISERFEGEAADKNPARATDRWAWDAQGRLLWHANALGFLRTRSWDSEGRLVRAALQSATLIQSLTIAYDELGRPVARTDGAGRTQRMAYGADGMPMTYRDPLGRILDRDTRIPTATRRDTALPVRVERPQQLYDDFGRNVLTVSADSGRTWRRFGAAGRMIGMTDAEGNHASYTYDAQGRIVEQTLTEAGAAIGTTTRWRYARRHLLEVTHPTQSERFEYDARGLRSARIVSRPAQGDVGPLTAITRYEHDAAGRLAASTLPDGSRLIYERNGQGQVVALKRQTVRTPWLRWLGQDQIIARDLERDLVGLRSYRAGNGIQARHERSRSGKLARILYRNGIAAPGRLQARSGSGAQRVGYHPGRAIELLLGVAPAHAREPPRDASRESKRQETPGVLGLPADPRAIIDHRYLWSAGGHLIHSQQRAGNPSEHTQSSHAYDAAGRLVASTRSALEPANQSERRQVALKDGAEATPQDIVWRYAYDRRGRRVLSQQTSGQSKLKSATRASAYAAGSHRLLQAGARYSASGQPVRLGNRQYLWDALGRLAEIRERGATLARYRYDHRGLRIQKRVLGAAGQPGRTTQTLYDERRQPLAELDARGRVTRQYVWLADLPLAVMDTEGAALAAGGSRLHRIGSDLLRIVRSWLGGNERVTWLHVNHLGAPEAATDVKGRIVWRARYSPFGEARIRTDRRQPFTLELRLPGQVFDAETGLHYNRQRYYDPALGQYLTPDPLGTPDGPNPYAYVAFNPLGHIDPDGLVLFAFDGTQNGNPPKGERTLSNVVSFQHAYLDGGWKYVAGVGADHLDPLYGDILAADHQNGLIPDQGGNYSGELRIDRMMLYFADAAEALADEDVMDIDIVGFSRGAANARHFANLLVGMLLADGETIRYQKHDEFGNPLEGQWACQAVNFRFMGLFDTVLSTNRGGLSYELGIPGQFGYVVQAVALNEYRSAPAGDDAFVLAPINLGLWNNTRIHLDGNDHYGGFPLESIGASANTPGQVRLERGFIGAHADIGGGYGMQNGDNNHLSTVALSWMVAQAQIAGVSMDASQIDISMGENVYLHDQSNAIRFGNPKDAPDWWEVGEPMGAVYGGAEDRQVRGGLGGGTQRTQTFGPAEAGGNRSMTNADTHPFITYRPRAENIASDRRRTTDIPEFEGASGTGNPSNITGTVDMQAYVSWLRSHGYTLAGADPW